MSSKQSTSSSSSRDPWAPTIGGLKDVIGKTNTIANDTGTWTPTYSQNTTQGVNALGQLGANSSYGGDAIRGVMPGLMGGFATGNQQLQNSANGSMLNGNPYFRDSVNRAMGDAADMVQQQFSGAGRLGSGANTRVLADRLGGIANDAYMQNYNTERGYQQQAANALSGMGMQGAQLAGSVDGLDAAQVGRQIAAGNMQDQMDAQSRMAPVNATNWQAGLLGQLGNMGGTQNSQSTTTSTPSTASMIGGGLMTGLGLMSGFGAMPLMGGGSINGLNGFGNQWSFFQ